MRKETKITIAVLFSIASFFLIFAFLFFNWLLNSNTELHTIKAKDGAVLYACCAYGISDDFTYVTESEISDRDDPHDNYVKLSLDFHVARKNGKWIVYGSVIENKLNEKTNILIEPEYNGRKSDSLIFSLYETLRQRRKK